MNRHLILTVLPLALFTAAPVARGANDNPPSNNTHVSGRDFVAWTKEHAIHFDTLDWRSVDLDKLSVLDKALEGKRIVYLGEADHYVREKYDFQLIFIRYLFQKGWRHVGMEMGRSDGRRIDCYLETGDIAFLDRVASYGYKGDFRKGRSDVPKGMIPEKRNRGPEFFLNVRSGQYWFQKQLRSLNEPLPPGVPRLHWFGFDADLRPGGGYTDAAELLEPHRADPLAAEILRRLARVDDESRAEEIQRLQDLEGFLRDNDEKVRACLGDADAVELNRTLRALTAGFEFAEAAKEGPSGANWHEALRNREQTMFRQMDEVLADLPPDEKIILLGHMMHLSKDSDTLYFGFTDDPDRDPAWPTIGNYLAKKYPDQVYSIWMLYDHGRHGVPMLEEPIVEIESDPHRIEYLLAKVGSLFFLPLHTNDPREAYLQRERNFINNGQPGSGILANQADAFFFIAEINPPGGREPIDA